MSYMGSLESSAELVFGSIGDFQAEDHVDVDLLRSDDGGETWSQVPGGEFRGTVTGGCPDYPIGTQVLPDEPYPKGGQFATAHPFIISREVFKVELQDGSLSLLKYVMMICSDD
jgi:hypothetical protein